jgi:sporulation protein YlmC with PRC-barrel domain
MRLKELRGLPVIDPTAARKVGTVTNYLVDPAAGRVAALDIDPADASDGERVVGHRIRRVGRHAVILVGSPATTSNAALEQNDTWIDPASLEGLEVLGDDGDRIGRLMDASFDQNSLDIEAYLLNATFWQRLTGHHGKIQPAQVHSCSRELMMVTTGHMTEAASTEAASAGIGVPLKVEDRLPEPDKSPAENGQRVKARVE